MESEELKKKFLNFFKEKGHKVFPASSLIPEGDPSVLFTTAGMQQFKSFYINPENAPYLRIATIQPCIRTSDIDEVGDEYHLTFFEMLGNFSFGYPKFKNSYFKEEAIKWAWEFLVDVLKIEKERISVSYFSGEKNIPSDEESLIILKSIKDLPKSKIKGMGLKETFWSLGQEGAPAGRTVEFYIDGIEVWNLVFNEYIFEKGEYKPSLYKGVDTGMGLERLLAVIMKEKDVFKTPVFWPLILIIEKNLGLKYEENKEVFRIIADHIKAAVFLTKEGIIPSNKDQGYISRRLIRRALMNIFKYKEEIDWLKDLISEVCEIYNFGTKETDIKEIIFAEMLKFKNTLNLGKKIIEKLEVLDAKKAFDLYQTYGLPFEFTKEYAKEKGVEINEKDFRKELKRHQALSRSASKGMFKGGLAGKSKEIVKLHTATHLLLASLRKILGNHVVQKGSNITEERLRLDFSHPKKLTEEELKKVEDLVNEKIKEGLPVEMRELKLSEAKKEAALGVFDDRYGEIVRVYSIGDFSKEICGGPHVENTKELGHFKIIKEEAVSRDTRRIRAILE